MWRPAIHGSLASWRLGSPASGSPLSSTLCRTLARVLRKSDFEVVEAESGRKAVAELEKTPFDVIVSDVQMAEMGLEVLRALCSTRPRHSGDFPS